MQFSMNRILILLSYFSLSFIYFTRTSFGIVSTPVHDDIFILEHQEECHIEETLSEYLFSNHLLDYPEYDALSLAVHVGSQLYSFERNVSDSHTLEYDKIVRTSFKNKTKIARRDDILAVLTILFYQERLRETEEEKNSHKIYRVSVAFSQNQIADVIDNSLLPNGKLLQFARKLPCVIIDSPESSYYFPAVYVLPNDPQAKSDDNENMNQWYLGGFNTYHLHSEFGANIAEAWSYHRGENNSVRVAIIGPGCGSHRDLQYNYLHQDIEDIGKNFADVRQNPLHEPVGLNWGTSVAGIIAGTSNNNYGAAGICWACKLTCLKVYHDDGTLNRAAVVEALRYVQQKNISLVYLGYSSSEYSTDEVMELEKMATQGILTITPAGNRACNIQREYPKYSQGCQSKDNIKQVNLYPALYGMKNLLVVGSSETDGSPSRFSNWGASSVHIMAPGSSILAAVAMRSQGKDYEYRDGTEYSAAIVTGISALMWSRSPNLNYEDIKEILLRTAQKNDLLKRKCVSGGIVDAGKALKAVQDQTVEDYPEPKEYPFPQAEDAASKFDDMLGAYSSQAADITWKLSTLLFASYIAVSSQFVH